MRTLPNPSYFDVSTKTSAARHEFERIRLKSEQADLFLQARRAQPMAQVGFELALPENPRAKWPASRERAQRVDQQRQVLRLCQAARGHDGRPAIGLKMRRQRLARLPLHIVDIDRVGHHRGALASDAVVGHEIVSHAFRRRCHEIGARVDRACHGGKHSPVRRPPPVIVGISKKRRERRLLADHIARADSRGANGGVDHEMAEERHRHVKPFGCEKATELEQTAATAAGLTNDDAHVRRHLIEVGAFASEEVKRHAVVGDRQCVHQPHGRPLCPAAVERGKDEHDARLSTMARRAPSISTAVRVMRLASPAAVARRARW